MNNSKEQTGKEGKSADKEQMLYDCKKKIAHLHGFATWTDLMVTYFSATAYGKISIAFEEVCEMYSQQRIAELEAELKRKDEALLEITKTNWVNGKYFGRSSAQLHLTATQIAEQALKPKDR